mmetsp:Transcript_3312/g.7790  ORF Transcript_3312/g.7790 Transcript_3312/m.7790 type:complete len:376 (+) Transcript_3312:51-1178(+)|eukprot:3211467-Rhodomonas_salina.1
MWKQLSIAVLGFAVVVGMIGKLSPTLFLKLPMGFIPWAITGNPMPPFFFADAFEPGEFKSFTKDGDLIVSTGIKSGTHWMLYCSHQIRTKGMGEWHDPNLEAPWLDMIHKPGQTWHEIKELMNTTVLRDGSRLKDYWDSPSYPFRIFKSHYFPRMEEGGILPVRENPKVKFLAMVRNGKDMFRSLVPHFNAHRASFREIWGGFPPPSSDEGVFKEILPGGTLAHLYWDYVRKWWAMKNEPNVLLLHFADAVKDLTKTVQDLAKFLDVKLSSSELSLVTERCSISHMKSVESKMKILAWGNPDVENLSFFCGGKDDVNCDVAEELRWSLIRKGQNGDGAAFFTEEMDRIWQQTLLSEFQDPIMRQWSQDGGVLPAL